MGKHGAMALFLAMPDLGPHAAFFATQFPPTLA
jgi:hypothetical protein